MERVFLSYHFEDPDRDLVEAVEAQIESQGLEAVVGVALGGAAVSEEVKRRIGQSDACVGLATPRDPLANGRFRTHPWVEGEAIIARTLNKPTILVVEKTVDLMGPFTEHERIDYQPSRPLPALTKLARTLAGWQRASGRPMRAVVLPPDLAVLVAQHIDDAVCEYRTYDRHHQKGAWRAAALMPGRAGTIVYIDGAHDDQFMQVRIRLDGRTWCSAAVEPFAQVHLEKEA